MKITKIKVTKDDLKQQELVLKKSLENVMMESEKISNDLIKTFDNSIRSFNEIHEKICTKEKRLEDNISHAEELIKTIESIKSMKRPGNTDPYNIAAELILKGYSAEDVQRECGLSINEIELIKQLSFHKKNSSVVG